MRQEHRYAYQPAEDCKGVQKVEQAEGIGGTQFGVVAEGDAFEKIAHGDTEHERRHRSTDKQGPIPAGAPPGARHFASKLEADRPQDERRQYQQHRQVESGEARGIKGRPSGKYRASPRINHTWLPSQTGPTVLITTRRSVSPRAMNGKSMPTPRSKPSMIAKPINRMPSSSHQMIFNVSKSNMIAPSAADRRAGGRLRRRR